MTATAPAQSGARVAYDTIAENFGAGANGPLLVVVDTRDADDPQAAVDAVDRAGRVDRRTTSRPSSRQ